MRLSGGKGAVIAGEIVDATFMSAKHLRAFLDEQIRDSKQQNVLFSLHLKATMMKVSDPIIFGHGVTVFFDDVFAKHEKTFNELGVNANNGLGDVYAKIKDLPADQKEEIEADIKKQLMVQMVKKTKKEAIMSLMAKGDLVILPEY